MQFNLNHKIRGVVPFYYRKQGIFTQNNPSTVTHSSHYINDKSSSCNQTNKSAKHFSYQRYLNNLKKIKQCSITETETTTTTPSFQYNSIQYTVGQIVYSLSPLKNYFVKSRIIRVFNDEYEIQYYNQNVLDGITPKVNRKTHEIQFYFSCDQITSIHNQTLYAQKILQCEEFTFIDDLKMNEIITMQCLSCN
jgi:hypothetical protein